MSEAARIRVLHVVRTALPEGVVTPEDVVVYAGQAAVGAGEHELVWMAERGLEGGLSSEELCELFFAAERVVVW